MQYYYCKSIDCTAWLIVTKYNIVTIYTVYVSCIYILNIVWKLSQGYPKYIYYQYCIKQYSLVVSVIIEEQQCMIVFVSHYSKDSVIPIIELIFCGMYQVLLNKFLLVY